MKWVSKKRKKKTKAILSRSHHSYLSGRAWQVCFLFLIFFMTDCPFKLLASLILLYQFQAPGKYLKQLVRTVSPVLDMGAALTCLTVMFFVLLAEGGNMQLLIWFRFTSRYWAPKLFEKCLPHLPKIWNNDTIPHFGFFCFRQTVIMQNSMWSSAQTIKSKQLEILVFKDHHYLCQLGWCYPFSCIRLYVW